MVTSIANNNVYTSNPALQRRRAVYEVRDVPHLLEDPRSAASTYHTRCRAIHCKRFPCVSAHTKSLWKAKFVA